MAQVVQAPHAVVSARCAAEGSRSKVLVPSFASLRTSGFPAKAIRAISTRTSSQRQRRSFVVCDATAQTGETAVTVGAVTDATFKEHVLDSPVPVLVDFWAPWCGPCRMIEPLIAELAGQYGSKLKVFKMNTDENSGTATEFGIRSIPTVMIFKNGIKVDTVIGAVPKSTLTTTIDKYL